MNSKPFPAWEKSFNVNVGLALDYMGLKSVEEIGTIVKGAKLMRKDGKSFDIVAEPGKFKTLLILACFRRREEQDRVSFESENQGLLLGAFYELLSDLNKHESVKFMYGAITAQGGFEVEFQPT